MMLAPGSRLAHYDVTALIGEGGMGQVYQATDTKLNRQVALKILPEAFASDPDRLARFQREAQVLASLNHSNIAAIYGLEEAEDTRALVLELVEGPTLEDRIAQGPIPVDEALPMAKQIAEALEAAHEAGVIHRDLKPANIKMREDGTVKVLDFGLAKALDTTREGDPSLSPTLTAAATQMGVIMGTAAYMSPEQARGKQVDKRADIWAFGCVLYEMLTGVKAFEGEDVSLALSAVLQREADWPKLPPDTPSLLRRLLRRCLEKDRRRRLRDIGDAITEFDDVLKNEPVGPQPVGLATRRGGRGRTVLVATVASVLVGTVVAVIAWGLRPPIERPTRLTRFSVATPGLPALPRLSPDGQTIAFTRLSDAGSQVYTRSLDQLDVVPIAGTEGCFLSGFSPDGQWLLVTEFGQDGLMKRVPLTGGPGTPIANGEGRAASWNAAGTIVRGSRQGLLSVPALGGDLVPLTTLAEGEVAHFFPQFLPHGTAVLFQIWTGDRESSQVAVYDLNEGAHRTLLLGMSPQFAQSGHLIFWRHDALWAVPFDPERLEVRGTPVPVVEGVAAMFDGFGHYGVGSDGTLLYVPPPPTEARRSLVWVDREGREIPLAADAAPYSSLHLSPNGLHVIVEVEESVAAFAQAGANTDLWSYDLEQQRMARFTFDPAEDRTPVWTPDGARVVFSSTRDGDVLNLFVKAADGSGRAERLTTDARLQAPLSVSADGRTLLFTHSGSLWTLPIDGQGQPEILLEGSSDATLSPDGRWLAYVSASDEPQVFVRPFPNIDDRLWPVSNGLGQSPTWGRNGRELFYQTRTSPDEPVSVMAVAYDTEPSFRPSVPIELFQGSYRFGGRSFDVREDSQAFLMVKEDPGSAQAEIIVAQDWFEELKRLVPTN